MTGRFGTDDLFWAVTAATAGASVLLAAAADRPLPAAGVICAVTVTGAIVARPLALRALRRPRISAVRLPGVATPGRGDARARAVGIMLALVWPVAIGLVWLGNAPIAAIAAAALLAASAALTLDDHRRLRKARQNPQRVGEAVAAFAPQLILYTARADDGAYQVRMWLPFLDAARVPYLIVVRDPRAAATLGPLTTTPLLVCPEPADLDQAVVPGVRAVFYVNTIPQNVDIVSHRGPVHVYLGHGDSDKELSSHPAHAMFDQVWVATELAASRYATRGVRIESEKLVVVGRPQLAEVERATVAGPAPSTVLYAPTWQGYNAATALSSLPHGPQVVSALLEARATVAFRPHPFSTRTRAGRRTIRRVEAMLSEDARKTGRRHLVGHQAQTPPLARIFNQVDALVCDPSSVVVDFLASAKPVAVLAPPPVGGSGRDRRAVRGLDPAVVACVDVVDPALSDLGNVVADLLSRRTLRPEQQQAAGRYLGPRPAGGWDAPFAAALAGLLAGAPQRPRQDR